MADISIAAPQSFTFGTLQLEGVLLNFSGQSQRRGVVHQFPKRAGAFVEDMERAPRRLEVQLIFLGTNPAQSFNDFESTIHDNPTQLLVHPVAGKFTAFCEGPQHSVDFSQAINGIRVRVAFVESELDASTKADIPDVATAAQSASAQQSTYQKAVAAYLGAFAKLNTALGRARNSIDTVVANIETFTDPVTETVTQITSIPGVASSVIGALTAIRVTNDVLNQSISNFLTLSTDLFTGSLAVAGSADATVNSLGKVQVSANILETTLIDTGSIVPMAGVPLTTPAGAAGAVGSVEEMVASCLILNEAVLATRPPVIVITIPKLTDIVTFCQQRYPDNAISRANDILGMNKIINPAAIPAGTRLSIPSV